MGINILCKIEAARDTMGIHLSCQIGAVQPIFQRARARSKMETHIHFHAKMFTNISLKEKKLCSTRAGPIFLPDKNVRDSTSTHNMLIHGVPQGLQVACLVLIS